MTCINTELYISRADNWKVEEADYNETVDGMRHNGITEFGKVCRSLTDGKQRQ